jgi:hypothetical protein
MPTVAFRCISLAALVASSLPLTAQTFTRAQLEQQYQLASAPSDYRSTPVDQYGRPCISLANQKTERWGTNKENTSIKYFFRNGCNQGINVIGQFAQADGSEREGQILVCPGATSSLVCSGLKGGKQGCQQMTSFYEKPAPGWAGSCRRSQPAEGDGVRSEPAESDGVYR